MFSCFQHVLMFPFACLQSCKQANGRYLLLTCLIKILWRFTCNGDEVVLLLLIFPEIWGMTLCWRSEGSASKHRYNSIWGKLDASEGKSKHLKVTRNISRKIGSSERKYKHLRETRSIWLKLGASEENSNSLRETLEIWVKLEKSELNLKNLS